MSCSCGELVRLDAELSGTNVLDDPIPHIDDLDDYGEDDDEATRLISTVPRKLTLSSLGAKAPAPTAQRGVRWFVNLNGSHTVEMTTEDVLLARADGRVGPDVLVWRPGMVGWHPVRNVLKSPGQSAEGGDRTRAEGGRTAPRSAPDASDLGPLPGAPRLPSSKSMGPPVPIPPRPVRTLEPPPAPAVSGRTRSAHTSDPSLGVYERGIPTVDFEARARHSSAPPPPPVRDALARSIAPVRLPPGDARSPTLPPARPLRAQASTQSASRAQVPGGQIASPPVVSTAMPIPPREEVRIVSAPASSTPSLPKPVAVPVASRGSAPSIPEDTAISRSRATRRRWLTLAGASGAAIVLVASGAGLTRALKGSKRRAETASIVVPSVTTPSRRAPSQPPVQAPSENAEIAADSPSDAVNVENLPVAEQGPTLPRRAYRAVNRSGPASPTTLSAAAAQSPRGRAADQIVLEEEAPAAPAGHPPGSAPAPKPTTAPAQEPKPTSGALQDPGF
jgi:hypothetical protein